MTHMQKTRGSKTLDAARNVCLIGGKPEEWRTMSKDRKEKLQLKYPCLWIYKVIGRDQDEMRRAIQDLVRDRSCKISLSRESETAKYISLAVELTVESESHRTALYEELKAHPAIKLVL